MKYKRIYILGTSGSGKTFLGKLLSKKLKIPHYDSDDVMYIHKYTKTRSKEKRKIIIDRIAKRKKWIIDGRGSDWCRNPMKKSDVIIWVQTPMHIRVIRILKRYYSRKKNKPRLKENFSDVLRIIKYSCSYKFVKTSSSFKRNKDFMEENRLKPIIVKNEKEVAELVEKLVKR